MKLMIENNAEAWSSVTFNAGWLLVCVFWGIYEVLELKGFSLSTLVWFGIMLVTAIPVMLMLDLRARRAAGRAYELGKSDGMVEVWTRIETEIRRQQ